MWSFVIFLVNFLVLILHLLLVLERHFHFVALAHVPASVVHDSVCLLVVVQHVPLLPVLAFQLGVHGIAIK